MPATWRIMVGGDKDEDIAKSVDIATFGLVVDPCWSTRLVMRYNKKHGVLC